MLSFFPRGVLDEILNLIESVSEGFPSYSHTYISPTVIYRDQDRYVNEGVQPSNRALLCSSQVFF